MNEEYLKEFNEKIEESFINFEHKLNKIRAEGANPNILDSVTINYYGNFTPLPQLSNIFKKDANLLIIKPYDKAIIKEILVAINNSVLELSANLNGDEVRIFVPPLTEEKRKHFVKLAKEISEEGKISIRNLRHDFIKKYQRENITEDQKEWLIVEIQNIVDTYNKKIEEKYKEKSKKLMII